MTNAEQNPHATLSSVPHVTARPSAHRSLWMRELPSPWCRSTIAGARLHDFSRKPIVEFFGNFARSSLWSLGAGWSTRPTKPREYLDRDRRCIGRRFLLVMNMLLLSSVQRLSVHRHGIWRFSPCWRLAPLPRGYRSFPGRSLFSAHHGARHSSDCLDREFGFARRAHCCGSSWDWRGIVVALANDAPIRPERGTMAADCRIGRRRATLAGAGARNKASFQAAVALGHGNIRDTENIGLDHSCRRGRDCGGRPVCCRALQANSQIDRGKYLVVLASCNDCHTPRVLFGQSGYVEISPAARTWRSNFRPRRLCRPEHHADEENRNRRLDFGARSPRRSPPESAGRPRSGADHALPRFSYMTKDDVAAISIASAKHTGRQARGRRPVQAGR